MALLEACVKEDLNKTSHRMMAVLDPIHLIIDNYPEGESEFVDVENNPEDETAGSRKVKFSRELYIESKDFKEEASRKFFRLKVGGEVRLKGAYIIKCTGVDKDEAGNILTVHCDYDDESKSGSGSEASKRKIKGTLHWVSTNDALDAEVRLYDRLFKNEDPAGNKEIDFKEFINENSLEIVKNCKVESGLGSAKPGERFQFQRIGYFCVDDDSTPNNLIFNRTVALRDSWSKKNS